MKPFTYKCITGDSPIYKVLLMFYLEVKDGGYNINKFSVEINESDDDVLNFEKRKNFITWFSREFKDSEMEINKPIPDNVKEIGFWILLNSYMNLPKCVSERIKSGRTKIKHYIEDYG